MRRMPRSHAVRRLAVTAVAALALAGLAACGDGSSEDATGTDPAGASIEPAEVGETVDPEDFVDDVITGITDASTAHLTMALEGGPAGITMEGDVDYSASPPEMAMTMTNTQMGGGEMQVVLVDGVLYVKMPDVGRGKWVKMDLSAEGSPLSGDLMGNLDPSEQLSKFKESVTKVEFVGEEDVDGESLKRYTMTMRADALKDLQEELGTSERTDLPSVITYDLWLDDDGVLRQTKVAMGDLGSVTMTLSEWGEPVDIEAPASADVVEMPEGMMG